MFDDHQNPDNNIIDLAVYASGTYPVEISKGKQINQAKRVKLNASVDRQTGAVTFFVDKTELTKLE